jgi:signal peptidase II
VIPGFFDIVHTENRGMAFGLFSRGESTIRSVLLVGVALVVLVVVVVMLWRLPAQAGGSPRLTSTALALVLGGAIGNLYDRAFRGSVTDFLDVYIGDWHWPAFNVADSAISVGAVLLVLTLLAEKDRAKEN